MTDSEVGEEPSLNYEERQRNASQRAEIETSTTEKVATKAASRLPTRSLDTTQPTRNSHGSSDEESSYSADQENSWSLSSSSTDQMSLSYGYEEHSFTRAAAESPYELFSQDSSTLVMETSRRSVDTTMVGTPPSKDQSIQAAENCSTPTAADQASTRSGSVPTPQNRPGTAPPTPARPQEGAALSEPAAQDTSSAEPVEGAKKHRKVGLPVEPRTVLPRRGRSRSSTPSRNQSSQSQGKVTTKWVAITRKRSKRASPSDADPIVRLTFLPAGHAEKPALLRGTLLDRFAASQGRQGFHRHQRESGKGAEDSAPQTTKEAFRSVLSTLRRSQRRSSSGVSSNISRKSRSTSPVVSSNALVEKPQPISRSNSATQTPTGEAKAAPKEECQTQTSSPTALVAENLTPLDVPQPRHLHTSPTSTLSTASPLSPWSEATTPPCAAREGEPPKQNTLSKAAVAPVNAAPPSLAETVSPAMQPLPIGPSVDRPLPHPSAELEADKGTPDCPLLEVEKPAEVTEVSNETTKPQSTDPHRHHRSHRHRSSSKSHKHRQRRSKSAHRKKDEAIEKEEEHEMDKPHRCNHRHHHHHHHHRHKNHKCSNCHHRNDEVSGKQELMKEQENIEKESSEVDKASIPINSAKGASLAGPEVSDLAVSREKTREERQANIRKGVAEIQAKSGSIYFQDHSFHEGEPSRKPIWETDTRLPFIEDLEPKLLTTSNPQPTVVQAQEKDVCNERNAYLVERRYQDGTHSEARSHIRIDSSSTVQDIRAHFLDNKCSDPIMVADPAQAMRFAESVARITHYLNKIQWNSSRA